MAKKKSKFLSGKRIDPTPIDKNTVLADLIKVFSLPSDFRFDYIKWWKIYFEVNLK